MHIYSRIEETPFMGSVQNLFHVSQPFLYIHYVINFDYTYILSFDKLYQLSNKTNIQSSTPSRKLWGSKHKNGETPFLKPVIYLISHHCVLYAGATITPLILGTSVIRLAESFVRIWAAHWLGWSIMTSGMLTDGICGFCGLHRCTVAPSLDLED